MTEQPDLFSSLSTLLENCNEWTRNSIVLNATKLLTDVDQAGTIRWQAHGFEEAMRATHQPNYKTLAFSILDEFVSAEALELTDVRISLGEHPLPSVLPNFDPDEYLAVRVTLVPHLEHHSSEFDDSSSAFGVIVHALCGDVFKASCLLTKLLRFGAIALEQATLKRTDLTESAQKRLKVGVLRRLNDCKLVHCHECFEQYLAKRFWARFDTLRREASLSLEDVPMIIGTARTSYYDRMQRLREDECSDRDIIAYHEFLIRDPAHKNTFKPLRALLDTRPDSDEFYPVAACSLLAERVSRPPISVFQVQLFREAHRHGYATLPDKEAFLASLQASVAKHPAVRYENERQHAGMNANSPSAGPKPETMDTFESLYRTIEPLWSQITAIVDNSIGFVYK